MIHQSFETSIISMLWCGHSILMWKWINELLGHLEFFSPIRLNLSTSSLTYRWWWTLFNVFLHSICHPTTFSLCRKQFCCKADFVSLNSLMSVCLIYMNYVLFSNCESEFIYLYFENTWFGGKHGPRPLVSLYMMWAWVQCSHHHIDIFFCIWF